MANLRKDPGAHVAANWDAVRQVPVAVRNSSPTHGVNVGADDGAEEVGSAVVVPCAVVAGPAVDDDPGATEAVAVEEVCCSVEATVVSTPADVERPVVVTGSTIGICGVCDRAASP